MRSATIIQTAAVLTVIILACGDSRQALGDDIKLDMPKEAFGFRGTLSAEVVKAPDPKNGWFQIRVVKVLGFAPNNMTKLNAKALTEVWKDKCEAILGTKNNMPELKVGDMVTVTAATVEVHLRATRVTKDKPPQPK